MKGRLGERARLDIPKKGEGKREGGSGEGYRKGKYVYDFMQKSKLQQEKIRSYQCSWKKILVNQMKEKPHTNFTFFRQLLFQNKAFAYLSYLYHDFEMQLKLTTLNLSYVDSTVW